MWYWLTTNDRKIWNQPKAKSATSYMCQNASDFDKRSSAKMVRWQHLQVFFQLFYTSVAREMVPPKIRSKTTKFWLKSIQ